MPIWDAHDGKVRFEGRVIEKIDKQDWGGDTDWYAVVWDGAKGGPTEVWLCSNGHAGGGHKAEIDATPEIREKYSNWCRATGCKTIEQFQVKKAKLKEEEALVEQKRLADERAQRRKQQDEEDQQIMKMRKSLRQCVMCGQPLGALDRFLKHVQHRKCGLFFKR